MSSLNAAYQSFLSNPTGALLKEEASLNYITTLTTINDSAGIVKHFSALQKVLKKKEEKVINAIESDNALCLEIDTTIEFLTGGAAYLPGVEENFLSDRVVSFPIIHIVHFDANQKIQTIRLNWDQGSLLKQVDVIGARARAWPIRDGKDQTRLIASSAASTSQSDQSSKPSASKGQPRDSSPGKASRSRNNTNTTRDPHASLALFGTRDEADDESSPQHAPIAPRGASARPPPRDYGDIFAGEETEPARPTSPQKENRPIAKAQSAKPPPRDYHDLFVGHESDASPASKDKPSSPLKNITSPIPMAPKGGAGKNFQPIRLFENAGTEAAGTQQGHQGKARQPQSKHIEHFQFGDGNDQESAAQPAQSARPKTGKHQSQWGFEDFMTPEKVPTKNRPHETRHFGWSDDEPVMNSPIKNVAKHQPRPDAKSQFEFQDDGTPAGERRPTGQPRGNVKAHGMGLYQDNLFDGEADGKATEMGKKNHPLATVTNLQQRGKAFEHQFNIHDEPSPAGDVEPKNLAENRKKATKMMESQWEASDTGPAPAQEKKGKENFPTAAGAKNIGIKSEGDGMGGKKGGHRGWGFGDESDGDDAGVGKTKKFQAERKQRPGETRNWGFGDDSDGEEAGGVNTKKFQPQRKQHGTGARSEGWNF